jgi:hypothetical protein
MKKIISSSAICSIFIGILVFIPECIKAQSLPAVWQPDTHLSITVSGGMRDHTHTVFISDGSSYESESGEGDNSNTQYVFISRELNDLALFLKKKHFDKFKTVKRKKLVPDMETSTTELQIGSKVYSVSTGASMEVAAPYQQNDRDIDHYITRLLLGKKKE